MSLSPEEVTQLRRWIVEIVQTELADVRVATQLAINRGVVQTVDDSQGVQELQCTATQDEVLDEIEHFQGYGFSAHPPAGSEACLVTVGDDRAHMIALGTNDRASRCVDLEAGDTCMYSLHGTQIHMYTSKGSGWTTHTVPTGGKIQLGDSSAEDPVALQSLVHRSLDLITATITTWANALPVGPVLDVDAIALATALVAAVNTPASIPPGAGPFVGASKVLGV